MSALPKSVQKQIKAAEEAHAKAYSKPDEKSGDQNLEDANDEAAQSQTPPEGIQSPPAAEAQPVVTPPTGEETSPAEPPADEGPPSATEPDAWEKRYSILKGKYDAEVPRQAKQIKELKNELASLRGLLAQMNEQKPASSPDSSETPAPTGIPARLLKQQEIEDYGDELISVIHRGAQEVFNPEIAALKEEIKQLKGQLGGVSQTLHSSQRDTVLDILTREVPDWKTLNEDELFLSWLDQVDTFSGEPRQALLDRAFGSGDAARVVAFFKGYLNENAALQPPQQDPAPQPRNTQTKLDDMVAPGKPKGASGGAQQGEKRTWTQKQIAKFYHDVNKGKYRTQPDKQNAIERDIVAAGREGRITA